MRNFSPTLDFARKMTCFCRLHDSCHHDNPADANPHAARFPMGKPALTPQPVRMFSLSYWETGAGCVDERAGGGGNPRAPLAPEATVTCAASAGSLQNIFA